MDVRGLKDFLPYWIKEMLFIRNAMITKRNEFFLQTIDTDSNSHSWVINKISVKKLVDDFIIYPLKESCLEGFSVSTLNRTNILLLKTCEIT